jgi:hypothetical protein
MCARGRVRARACVGVCARGQLIIIGIHLDFLAHLPAVEHYRVDDVVHLRLLVLVERV